MNEIDLIHLARKKGRTIGSCESLTAGLFCAKLTSVPGASQVLKGGFVTYFTEIKETVVGVDSQVIHQYGVISKQCAEEMAIKAKKLLDVDYCVSFTGNAGPDTMEGKPAGDVFCAISGKEGTISFSFHFKNEERNTLRQHVVDEMISRLADIIEKE